MGEFFDRIRGDFKWYVVSVAILTGISFVFDGWIDFAIRGIEHASGFWEILNK